jgi:hypothetical protein
MAADERVTQLEEFLVERGQPLLRVAVLLGGGPEAGEDLLQVALGNWFLMLADAPGVTVQQVTDVTGQADVAFRFPFTDGVTEILLGAHTHQLVGYVRNGIETVITKEVTVSGPGSHTPVVIHPRPGPLPPARR